MELKHLEYFLTAASSISLSEAADKLCITQPTLSRCIQKLEAELGNPLFFRVAEGISLTPAGEHLVHGATAIMGLSEQIKKDFDALSRGSTGHVSIGFVGTATHRIMPDVVQGLRQILPKLEVQVYGELTTPKLERMLLENRLNLAILRPPIASRSIRLETLSTESFVLYVPDEPAWNSLPPTMSFVEALELDLVSFPRGSAAEQTIVNHALARGVQVSPVQRSTDTGTILAMIRGGIGGAILPEGGAPESLWGLRKISLTDGPMIDLALAWHPQHSTPLVSSVRNHLQTLIPRLPQTSFPQSSRPRSEL